LFSNADYSKIKYREHHTGLSTLFNFLVQCNEAALTLITIINISAYLLQHD